MKVMLINCELSYYVIVHDASVLISSVYHGGPYDFTTKWVGIDFLIQSAYASLVERADIYFIRLCHQG